MRLIAALETTPRQCLHMQRASSNVHHAAICRQRSVDTWLRIRTVRSSRTWSPFTRCRPPSSVRPTSAPLCDEIPFHVLRLPIKTHRHTAVPRLSRMLYAEHAGFDAGNDKHKTLHAAYAYYYFHTSTPLPQVRAARTPMLLSLNCAKRLQGRFGTANQKNMSTALSLHTY